MSSSVRSCGLTRDLEMLLSKGLSCRVCEFMIKMFNNESINIDPRSLDDLALSVLKEFPENNALEILNQFSRSNLANVNNKSAFLCGIMRSYREKMKLGGLSQVLTPEPAKISELLSRGIYSRECTPRQRKYRRTAARFGERGFPTTWTEESGTEVFIGKIPRDCLEDELIPLLEKCGEIREFRLQMDPATGLNKGFAFCTFTKQTSAYQAITTLNDKDIRPGRRLAICKSRSNSRLFVKGIPKRKSKEEIFQEFSKVTTDLQDVTVYQSCDQGNHGDLNRGFVFLEYANYIAAASALHRFTDGKVRIWGKVLEAVTWAEAREIPDDAVMSKVKSIYVRNVPLPMSETQLKAVFTKYGQIEKVRKIRDYGFVYFAKRESAVQAIDGINRAYIDGCKLEVSLAIPQSSR
ncbi:heterogeneous nuclear ribonucleoprotein R [Nematostella vectensis]|uniref:heterogeneous nuclear ribonucleoprotein R n=1 Tax=Nematostella vectensis TaxID=45351 RepID=UPI00207779AC|nr:heterogeneous nuclear ribonucleoprotein R [Nematostella vectensis]